MEKEEVEKWQMSLQLLATKGAGVVDKASIDWMQSSVEGAVAPHPPRDLLHLLLLDIINTDTMVWGDKQGKEKEAAAGQEVVIDDQKQQGRRINWKYRMKNGWWVNGSPEEHQWKREEDEQENGADKK